MNRKYADILKLARIQILATVVFIFFKLIRPSVLESASPELFKIFLLSLPNFFEAVVGILTLTGIVLIINDRFNKKHQIKAKSIYLLTVVLSGVYVILQELNIIDIRTNTTMDPNDIIFSAVGLLIGYWIILYIKPRILVNEINL